MLPLLLRVCYVSTPVADAMAAPPGRSGSFSLPRAELFSWIEKYALRFPPDVFFTSNLLMPRPFPFPRPGPEGSGISFLISFASRRRMAPDLFFRQQQWFFPPHPNRPPAWGWRALTLRLGFFCQRGFPLVKKKVSWRGGLPFFKVRNGESILKGEFLAYSVGLFLCSISFFFLNLLYC